MMKKISALAASAFAAALMFPSNVFGADPVPPSPTDLAKYGVATQNIAGSGDLKTVIQGGINFFLGLLGIIAVIVIIISGFQWMTAESEEKVKEARKRLINSIIGLVVIFAAYGIVYVILNTVGQSFFKTTT